MIGDAALGLAVVLIASAAGSGDYVLSVQRHGVDTEIICAKSAATCEAARDAIRAGRWPIAPADTPTDCRPSPGCFSEKSQCIQNYNCK